MTDPLVNVLERLEPFKALAPGVLQASQPLWKRQQLKSGRMLWKQGRPADSIAVIASGSLDVMVNGTTIYQIDAPAMIGETALFFTGAQRISSISAATPTVVFTLGAVELRGLRAADSPLYAAILDQALVSTVRRARELDREIAMVHQGNFAVPPPREETTLLTRLWQRLRPAPAPEPTSCPPLAELLINRPLLAGQPEVREALVSAFTPQSFRKGDLLARRGEPRGSKAFILAAGRVDALQTVEDNGAALLIGRFEAGTIFGVQALLAAGPRPVSLVATEDGWAYVMDKATHDRLAPAIRTAWLEEILAVLTDQCQSASELLQTSVGAFSTHHEEAMPSRVMRRPSFGSGDSDTELPAGSDVADMREAPRRRPPR